MAGQWRTAVALIWHVGNAHKGIRRFTAVCHPDAKQRDIDPGVLRYQPTTWAEVKVPLPAGAMRVPHRDRQEILIALHPGPSIGEGLIHAGRLNIGKCKSLAPRRPLGRRAQRSSFQFEPRSRSVHEPQHGRVLPKKQTGGGAEARQALLDFSCVSYLVMREGHNALSVDETTFAFWALPRRSQVPGHDEVLGLRSIAPLDSELHAGNHGLAIMLRTSGGLPKPRSNFSISRSFSDDCRLWIRQWLNRGVSLQSANRKSRRHVGKMPGRWFAPHNRTVAAGCLLPGARNNGSRVPNLGALSANQDMSS